MSDVLIVGGGLAGLSCAHRLQERGVSFQLVEAADDVGGRVRTDRDLATSSRMFRFVFQMFGSGAVAVPRDGMGAIPAQLRRSLPDGCIHLNTPVARVERNAVQLGDGGRREGRCVVVATDLDAARRWLPERPARGWSGTTCLYFDAPAAPVTKPILVLSGEGHGVINNLHVVSQVNPACALVSGRRAAEAVVADGAR
jgi:phytoene dehydrogenase-like protein